MLAVTLDVIVAGIPVTGCNHIQEERARRGDSNDNVGSLVSRDDERGGGTVNQTISSG